MRGLLDDALLDGATEVQTLLRPYFLARPVPEGDLDAVITQIAWLCQSWAGASQPLLTYRDGQPSDLYAPLLTTSHLDGVATVKGLELTLPDRVKPIPARDLPAMVIASDERRDNWRTVSNTVLDTDDPWRGIYAAVLGLWPDTPNHDLHFRFDQEPFPGFDTIVPLTTTQVTGSLTDLLARLDDFRTVTPRQVANVQLATGTRADTSFMGSNGVIPAKRDLHRRAWPNVVVVVSPDQLGGADDVALL